MAVVVQETPTTYKTKSTLFKMYQFIWYVVYLIEVLLGLRILFRLLGANPMSSFVSFLYTISGIFVAPFRLIFPTPAEGSFALDTAAIVALVMYPLGAYLLVHLLQLAKPTSATEVAQVDNTEIPQP